MILIFIEKKLLILLKISNLILHIHGQNPGGEDYLDKNKDPIKLR